MITPETKRRDDLIAEKAREHETNDPDLITLSRSGNRHGAYIAAIRRAIPEVDRVFLEDREALDREREKIRAAREREHALREVERRQASRVSAAVAEQRAPTGTEADRLQNVRTLCRMVGASAEYVDRATVLFETHPRGRLRVLRQLGRWRF